jgi:hypothetical protein
MYPFGLNFESPYDLSRLERRRAEDELARRQRRRFAEEAKRRSELEKYYRIKAREQEELQRRQLEYYRIKAREKEERESRQQEYRRQLELQQRQREKEEEQKRAYIAAQKAEDDAIRRQQLSRNTNYYMNETGGQESQPEFNIIRGRDGRLYQVRNPLSLPPAPVVERSSSSEEDRSEFRIVRRPDGRLCHVRNQPQAEQKAKLSWKMNIENKESRPAQVHQPNTLTSKKNGCANTSSCFMEVDDDNENFTPAFFPKVSPTSPQKKKENKGKKKKKNKITIVVEDASDSEYEDEFQSPWRNRRPSPGQWMEPVESFR